MTENIIMEMNEQGKFELKSKLEIVKDEMDSFLATIKELMRENAELKKPLQIKWQYRIKRKLTQVLRAYRRMSDTDALRLSAETINETYIDYLDLVSFFNMVTDFMPDKTEFCAFACISVNAYSQLLKNGTEEIKQLMGDIEADFVNATMSSGENGVTKERSSEIRLKAKGEVGHGIVEAQPDLHIINDNTFTLTPAQLARQIDSFKPVAKLLNKKK